MRFFPNFMAQTVLEQMKDVSLTIGMNCGDNWYCYLFTWISLLKGVVEQSSVLKASSLQIGSKSTREGYNLWRFFEYFGIKLRIWRTESQKAESKVELQQQCNRSDDDFRGSKKNEKWRASRGSEFFLPNFQGILVYFSGDTPGRRFPGGRFPCVYPTRTLLPPDINFMFYCSYRPEDPHKIKNNGWLSCGCAPLELRVPKSLSSSISSHSIESRGLHSSLSHQALLYIEVILEDGEAQQRLVWSTVMWWAILERNSGFLIADSLFPKVVANWKC